MGKKSERLSLIKRIITEELIGSQEELITHLKQRGVHATQSTLSRDFKEINISKVPHPEKGYIYVSSEHIIARADIGTSNLGEAVLGIKFSGNICLVMTKSGYANAVGAVIDSHKFSEIIGTVAGDNTILIVLREDVSHNQISEQLGGIFPSLRAL